MKDLCGPRAGPRARLQQFLVVKLHLPTALSGKKDSKLRFGLLGGADQRRSKIKAAIEANRETLRRLAK